MSGLFGIGLGFERIDSLEGTNLGEGESFQGSLVDFSGLMFCFGFSFFGLCLDGRFLSPM